MSWQEKCHHRRCIVKMVINIDLMVAMGEVNSGMVFHRHVLLRGVVGGHKAHDGDLGAAQIATQHLNKKY